MKNDEQENTNDDPSVVKKLDNDGHDGAVAKRNKRGQFQKGHKIGVRFGEGQPTHLGGRPKGGPSLVKQAMQLYESNALAAAHLLIEKALDRDADPKTHFAWFKELNHRIFGAIKGSAEDVIAQLTEKIEGAMSLSRSALEATAMEDAKGLVRELYKQGILDQVLEEVRGGIE